MKKLCFPTLLGTLALAGACDLPLDPPVWSTAWTLPGVVDTVATEELLPDDVTLEEGGGFLIEPVASSRAVVLGEVCPICTCFQGPIPPLALEPQEWSIPLPGRLNQATLRRGRARLVLHNQIPFDLLDDGAGNEGFLVVRLVDRFSRATLDSVRLEGSLPPGDSSVVAFDLSDRVLDRRLAARLEGTIPGTPCDTVSLEPEHGIRSEIFLEGLEASDVTVLVADESLGLPSRDLELPHAVAHRLRPGEARIVLRVQVENTVEMAVEILLSVATRRDDLFGPGAALFTPVLVGPASDPGSSRVEKLFALDVSNLQGADSVFIDTRNRVDGNRTVLIQGGEAVRYTATLHIDLPSR